MTAILDNPMAAGADYERAYAARFEFDPAAVQMQLGDARARFWRSMDDGDLCGELDEETVALVKAGDPNALGRHVLSRMNAWADRLAQREVYGS